MTETNINLRLYEALELRAEYDARLKTLKDCLPESRQNRDRLRWVRNDQDQLRPSPDFSPARMREQIKRLEFKRRKRNHAIQEANFQHHVHFSGASITLNEALEVRRGLNEEIGELHTRSVHSAYQRIIYKEDRDIVEPNELFYAECKEHLEGARLAFRELNRKIRAASFEVQVDFHDE
jgi:hypothetical protein